MVFVFYLTPDPLSINGEGRHVETRSYGFDAGTKVGRFCSLGWIVPYCFYLTPGPELRSFTFVHINGEGRSYTACCWNKSKTSCPEEFGICNKLGLKSRYSRLFTRNYYFQYTK
jgi:hypothetical protein